MKSPFLFQKISNHGSSNPIVARLAIQTVDLIQWLKATEDEKQTIIHTYMDLQRRLLNCFDIHQRLIVSNDKAITEAKEGWGKGLDTVPHVIGLQDEVESFLFAAKAYLREVALLVNNLFRANLPHEAAIFWDSKGGDSKLSIWARKKFGEDHETTRMLASEADWIGEVARKRNAVEHPNGKSGTLILTNYERIAEGIAPPFWAREGANPVPPTDIFNDISITMDNLLTLAEDLLVDAIRANPSFPQIRIVLIPEDKRDTGCPVRLKPTVDLENP